MAARRGTLIVISGPSGVGKGTLVRSLTEEPDTPAVSVSVTTREPRSDEVDGVDYRFVSDEAFDRMIRDGELLEWAPVVGHRSGTPVEPVREFLAAGRDVILEIDVQGAQQVRQAKPDAVLIFLAPPTMEELERRLRGRATESDDAIRTRIAVARREMGLRDRFDHVVVNDDLTTASSRVAAIIEASRAAGPDTSEDPSR